MTPNTAQHWLEKKVADRADISSAVVLLDLNGTLTQAAAWPREHELSTSLTVVAKEAFKTQKSIDWPSSVAPTQGQSAQRLSSKPLIQDGKLVGAIGFLTAAANDIGVPPPPAAATAPTPQRTIAPNLSESKALNILQVVATALSNGQFNEAASGVATELAIAFNCDRVSIGLTKGRFNQIVAVSHSADIQPTQSLMQLLCAAMDEAMDQGAAVQYPPVLGKQHQITLSHAELANRHNVQQILTVGMTHEQTVIGAILFERRDLNPFTDEQVELLEHLASTVGPVLELKRNNEYSWWARLRADFRQLCQKIASKEGRALRGVVAAAVFAIILLPLIPINYSLNSPARLEGVSQRMIVAPADGYLRIANVRPGDSIKAGEVLAEMADDDLRLERRRWEGEVMRYDSSFGEALKRQDRAQMASAQARASESRAQLALVDNQIERVRLVAPFDGVVLKGDLKQQLGAPLKRGDSLLVLAPANEYRVIVSVEDYAIESIAKDAKGHIRLTALPDTPQAIQVDRILPIANAIEGRNAFEVEAKLIKSPDGLRPGMEGVAKIEAGQRSLYWIVGHRLSEWFKLTFWSWTH